MANKGKSDLTAHVFANSGSESMLERFSEADIASIICTAMMLSTVEKNTNDPVSNGHNDAQY